MIHSQPAVNVKYVNFTSLASYINPQSIFLIPSPFIIPTLLLLAPIDQALGSILEGATFYFGFFRFDWYQPRKFSAYVSLSSKHISAELLIHLKNMHIMTRAVWIGGFFKFLESISLIINQPLWLVISRG